MTVPDCPHCDAANTLRPHGPVVQWQRWHWCSCCSKTSLVNLETGDIVRTGEGARIRP